VSLVSELAGGAHPFRLPEIRFIRQTTVITMASSDKSELLFLLVNGCPTSSLLGNRQHLPFLCVGQRPGGSQTGSQVAEGSQVATVRVLALFSGRIDIGLVAPLFEM